jgi:transposase
MKKRGYLSTLFVGIDVSSKTNTVCAIDFEQNQLLTCTVTNNQPGSDTLVDSLVKILAKGNFKYVMIALEATSSYSTHIATYLSDSIKLKPYGVLVYCLNPKTTHNYRKSFIGLPKTDAKDAYII